MPYIIEQCFSDNEPPFASRAQPNPMSPGAAKFSPYCVLRAPTRGRRLLYAHIVMFNG
jgi:hypothetical protein